MSIILKSLIETSPGIILNNLENLKEINDKFYLESINKINNDTLNEIILSIFENQFNSYFESIPKLSKEELKEYFNKYYKSQNQNKPNPTLILLDTSLDLFKQCLNYLEGIYNKEQEENKIEDNNNEHICKLYCISYIKMYLYKCIYFIHYNNQEFLEYPLINKAIEGNANNNFRKMIKIYVFKIFFHLLNNNYQEFSNYHYPNHGIKFFDEFKDKFNENKEAMLNYYLLPTGEEFKKYDEELRIFEHYRLNESFNKPTKGFKELIEKNGIDIFYTISSNSIVSKLALKNYVLNSQEYSQYSSFIKSLFKEQLAIPEITKKLFLLFSNDEEYNNKMKPKLILKDSLNINQKLFEILLYSLRYCLQTTSQQNSDGLLYSLFFSEQYSNKLKEISIPGNSLLDDIKVNNYYDIEKHLKTKADDIGAWVCSCGLYYDIPPCGFPWKPKKGDPPSLCANPKCGKPIGYAKKNKALGGRHSMAMREGHYRIFRDEKHKNKELSDYKDTEKNIQCMILADYKAKIIDPILKNSIFGINKISKIRFNLNNMIIRKLSQIGYSVPVFP